MIAFGPTSRPAGRRRSWAVSPLAALLIVLGQAAVSLAAGPVARVDGLEGRATVTRQKISRPLVQDYPLFLADAVATAKDCRLGLLFVDNTRLTVAEDTRLVITTWLFDPRKKVRRLYLSMVTGAVKFTTSRLTGFKDKRFQIKTYTATVGARGTSAIVLAGRRGPGTTAPIVPGGAAGPFTVVYNASQGPHPVEVVLNADPAQRRTLAPGDIVWVYARRFGPVGKASRGHLRQLNRKFSATRASGARQKQMQAHDLPDMVRSRVPGARRPRLILLRYLLAVKTALGMNSGPGNTYNYGGWYFRPLASSWARNTPGALNSRHGR